MRADRLVSIMLLLQAHGRMTAGGLAERLEVSRRTIHRDLEALGMAGVPVVVDRGAAGGASLVDGYRTDLTGFSEPELRALVAFGAGDLAADLGMQPALDSASRKLAAAAGDGRTSSLQQRVLIDGDTWSRMRTVPEHLARVQNALWSERRLRLRYRRGEQRVVERVVEPYGLVSKRGTWYLLAGVDGTRRVYRVSRIEDAEILPETFNRPRNFDLASAWGEAVASYRAAPPVRVVVRPRPDRAEAVACVYGENVVERRPNGLLELEFSSLEAAAGMLAGFGGSLEVVSPVALRQKLATIGQELLATYVDPAPPRSYGGQEEP
ncbi:MAG TPA: WYL domain-containing protein [Candidatus Binatia bacterium]|nr:WYL domain-containing protein [Candidatus Binatia bacterium]